MTAQLHDNATTTPRIRRQIQESNAGCTTLARRFGVSETTVRKWKKRETVEDGSHRPKELPTGMTAATEAVLVELRKFLLLSLDDLLRLGQEFLDPELSRSAVKRCLRRNEVNDLKALRAQQLGESESANKSPKTFKDYEPGFIHVDIKYLPQLPEESERSYLYIAIDRASNWTYFEVHDDRKAQTARSFLANLIRRANFVIKYLLTDNEACFTDRLNRPDEVPSGKHPVDQLCAAHGVEHRLIPPRHPQTNGKVERMNGRVSDVLASVHLQNREELEATLEQYRRLYNGQIPQKALSNRTPVEVLKSYYEYNPDIFYRKSHNPPAPDNLSGSAGPLRDRGQRHR